jgi:plastocyanin
MPTTTDTPASGRRPDDRHRRTWFRIAVIAACLALLAAACGDDDEGNASGTTGSEESGSEETSGTTPVSLEGEVNDHGTETVEGQEATLDLEADDFYFGPTFVQAEPGATITVEIENEGDATHTFTIDDQDIDETIDPGASVEVEVTAPDSDFVEFYCRFHRGQGMHGAIFVG